MKPKSFTQKKQSYWEITNSLSWLFLDACWMFDYEILSYVFILPTIISGIILAVKVGDINVRLTNWGVFSWSLMNVCWMCADYWKSAALLTFAKGLFPLGLVLIAIALYRSQNKKDILNQFKRFRMGSKPRNK